jgi:AraC family transcriptional regulator
MAGRSWTEAAHATGFADSAHLTRTCRRMFGMHPAARVPR